MSCFLSCERSGGIRNAENGCCWWVNEWMKLNVNELDELDE